MKPRYLKDLNYLKLLEIASSQSGVFTAKQALSVGINRKRHTYYVQSGYWNREYRGIYRLAHYPSDLDSHYVIWSLWSCNRKGVLQGIYSHETALSMYDLTDVNPAKIHMTVPPDFQRLAQQPDVLVLHKGRISKSQWRDFGGYRVTTPARTLFDVIHCGYISDEIIYQAIDEGLSRNLIVPKDVERYRLIRRVKRVVVAGSVKYEDANRFRDAVDSQISNYSGQWKIDKIRLRRHVAFERFMSRLSSLPSSPCILKGGYAMELLLWNYSKGKNPVSDPATALSPPIAKEGIDLGIRLKASRATKDIDIAFVSNASFASEEENQIEVVIRNAVAMSGDDFFSFEVTSKKQLGKHPFKVISFGIKAILAGKDFAHFRVDVGADEVKSGNGEQLEPPNLTRFAGIICPKLSTTSREQQFAEKIHAYTRLHRGERGTRVKDLVDMILLLENLNIDRAKFVSVIKTVFNTWGTHAIPKDLPEPPDDWESLFSTIASECQLGISIKDAFAKVSSFYSSLELVGASTSWEDVVALIHDELPKIDKALAQANVPIRSRKSVAFDLIKSEMLKVSDWTIFLMSKTHGKILLIIDRWYLNRYGQELIDKDASFSSAIMIYENPFIMQVPQKFMMTGDKPNTILIGMPASVQEEEEPLEWVQYKDVIKRLSADGLDTARKEALRIANIARCIDFDIRSLKQDKNSKIAQIAGSVSADIQNSANNLCGGDDDTLRSAMWNASQAVEKAIKILIIRYESDAPLSHDLLGLAQKAESLGAKAITKELLQKIPSGKKATTLRYSGEIPLATAVEVYRTALLLVRQIIFEANSNSKYNKIRNARFKLKKPPWFDFDVAEFKQKYLFEQ